jgi:putative colanic acid biosynthesis UDP-glucose lipid carrier transferase
MSLVGPRPHALSHDSYYEKAIEKYKMRFHVKPGITGWAQANGYRGATPTVDLMEKRIDHDIWYINNWSVWFDFHIILLTIVRQFTFPDAY